MHFVATTLSDAWLIEPERHDDERGFFTRLRCAREFVAQGLPGDFVQTNLSYNERAGTFRGLHYQAPPSNEGKLVRCISGAVADVIVDLRPGSQSYLRHEWVELTADSLAALFVPAGFAHGFLTRSDGAAVLYEMSDFYAPELGRGIRWDDPALGIEMPGKISGIHPRDAGYDDLDPTSLGVFEERP